jgi:hypothetical protein
MSVDFLALLVPRMLAEAQKFDWGQHFALGTGR